MDQLSRNMREVIDICREGICVYHSTYDPLGHIDSSLWYIETEGTSDPPKDISGFNSTRVIHYGDNSGILRYATDLRIHYINFGHPYKASGRKGSKANEISFPRKWVDIGYLNDLYYL